MDQVLLISERLLLREFEERDWKLVHEYASDPEVVRYMPWGPNSEEDSRNFVQRAIGYQREEPRLQFELAVVLKNENRLIGGCGIRATNPNSRGYSMGYCIDRRYWAKGYATEAARALLTFGFQQLGAHRVWATCDPANTASSRVLEKLGLKLEGHIREHQWVRGRWCDSLLHGILDRECKAAEKRN